jgi:outer membrane protein OmpA-like peptidoglycan-associated protein
MYYKKLLFISFLSITLNSISQKYIKKAETAYNSQNYATGVDVLKISYEKVSRKSAKAKIHKGDLAFKIAESYRLTERFKDANEWYERCILLEYQETQPLVFLYNGEMLRMMGELEKANKNYVLYKEIIPTDKRADVGISSCKIAQEMKYDAGLHIIENQIPLNKIGADMSPMFGDNKSTKLYFTSSRTGVTGSEIDPRSGENYMDIWVSEMDKKEHWGEPKLLLGKDINTENNEGSICFDSRFKLMFFTRCPNEKKKNLGCQIWVSESKGKDEWGEPKKIVLTPNDSITVGHPCASEDGKYLIFVSDLPGGFGGRDLWYSSYERKTDSWTVPINLGPEINTPGNEMFPTFGKNGDLYFATDGMPGLGGLDIFKATKINGKYKWENPKNLGAPINSENNDYSLIEYSEKKGYFTSERKNNNGGNEFDADIYSYNIPPNTFDLKIIISEVGNKKNRIQDVKVTVKGSDSANSWEGYTNKDGVIFWDKKPNGESYFSENMSYHISIEKEGFQEDKKGAQFTTEGLKSNQSFAIELALLPIVIKPIRLPEVNYILGQPTLLINDSINSKDSLNFVYNLLTEYPGMILELSCHSDSRGSDQANQVLSEARAKECVNYLVLEKGIDPKRIIAVGKGETEPAIWTDPTTGEKITLTEEYINQFKKSDKIKFEKLHQINRRAEGKVISMDFVPETTIPTSPE